MVSYRQYKRRTTKRLSTIHEDPPLTPNVANAPNAIPLATSLLQQHFPKQPDDEPRRHGPPHKIAISLAPPPVKDKKKKRSMFGRLKNKVSRSKLKHQDEDGHAQSTKHTRSHTQNGFLSPGDGQVHYMTVPDQITWDIRLNAYPHILTKIFGYICPHSKDRSYETANNVPLPDGTCMYCDLWTLKNCVQVCHAWRRTAQKSLYGSIRIDSVHFCGRDIPFDADEKTRKRLSRQPEDPYVSKDRYDPVFKRAGSLVKTLRENSDLRDMVEYIKLPSNLREDRSGVISKLVSTCPNLRYVDTAEGFYRGDRLFAVLRTELEVNCHKLSMMKYAQGSEEMFHTLEYQNPWPRLEILTLDNITLDLPAFRRILANLPQLFTLILRKLNTFSDMAFSEVNGLPSFPALPELELHDMSQVSIHGLLQYLETRNAKVTLKCLTLDHTGVQLSELHRFVADAARLTSLTVIQTVSQSISFQPPPPMTSATLETLHWEIKASERPLIHNPTESYNDYAATSITSHGFPSLTTIYTVDADMEARLTNNHFGSLPLPAPAFMGGAAPRQVQPEPFRKPLRIYIKENRDWNFNDINTAVRGEVYDTPLDAPGQTVFNARWSSSGTRHSIILPNGLGTGYLPPQPSAARSSSAGNSRSSSRSDSVGFLGPESAERPRRESRWNRTKESLRDSLTPADPHDLWY